MKNKSKEWWGRLATYVKSSPVVLGKQRIGIMSKTKEHPTVPIAVDHLPKCHGPGRKLFPTKATRRKIGMEKALFS